MQQPLLVVLHASRIEEAASTKSRRQKLTPHLRLTDRASFAIQLTGRQAGTYMLHFAQAGLLLLGFSTKVSSQQAANKR